MFSSAGGSEMAGGSCKLAGETPMCILCLTDISGPVAPRDISMSVRGAESLMNGSSVRNVSPESWEIM